MVLVRSKDRSYPICQNDRLHYNLFNQEHVSSCGLLCILFGSVSFMGFLFAAIISKRLPPSGNWLLSAIQNDRYYCLLVSLTLPVLVVAIYFHWLSMKLFKHA